MSEKRYNHVMGVCETAEQLSKIYGYESSLARTAALIHDCAKAMSNEEIISIVQEEGYSINALEEKNPQLLHGLAGAILGKKVMGICNDDVYNAVRYHTTGREAMSMLEKIIYISDYIEPSRDFPGVAELRNMAYKNINGAVLSAMENTIIYVVKLKQLLHLETIQARNYLLSEMKE
jgi:predicted HD superfamily hydrolase involved in NAD metabolism